MQHPESESSTCSRRDHAREQACSHDQAISKIPLHACGRSPSRAADYIVKCVLVGNYGVGKSSILSRYIRGQFSDVHTSTIGVDYATRVESASTCPSNVRDSAEREALVKLQIWDTAGQERFQSITRAYYRGAHLFIVVFSVACRDSFEALETWLSDMAASASEDSFVVIVGNKCDCEGRAVPTSEGEQFAQARDALYYEVSAKCDRGEIVAMMQAVTAVIVSRIQCQCTSVASSPVLPNGVYTVEGSQWARQERERCASRGSCDGCCTRMRRGAAAGPAATPMATSAAAEQEDVTNL